MITGLLINAQKYPSQYYKYRNYLVGVELNPGPGCRYKGLLKLVCQKTY